VVGAPKESPLRKEVNPMGLDVGVVSIEYLERPQGAAYEFIQHLAAVASCIGEGNAFGFYLREEMEEEAKGFLARMEASPEQVAEIEKWIEKLPWDESGYLTLAFNW
jgi:hypothetical protein